MEDNLTVMQRTALARLQNMIDQLADMGVTCIVRQSKDGNTYGGVFFRSDPIGVFDGIEVETHPDNPMLRDRSIKHNGLTLVLTPREEESDHDL